MAVAQDTLRLLTLWFAYGHDPCVDAAAVAGLREVRVEVWLEVVPQLIARIDHPSARVRSALQNLLLNVASAHPQALIYPMAVASNPAGGGLSGVRAAAATQIIHAMAATNRRLVDEATMVREEGRQKDARKQ